MGASSPLAIRTLRSRQPEVDAIILGGGAIRVAESVPGDLTEESVRNKSRSSSPGCNYFGQGSMHIFMKISLLIRKGKPSGSAGVLLPKLNAHDLYGAFLWRMNAN
jgi:hypothetical protein